MILGWRFFKSKKGFSLVEVMMASGLISLAGLAMMGLSQLANQDSLQLRATRIVLSARSQVEAALQNPASWQQTVAQNPSLLACATGSGCSLASTSTGYYDFVLYGTGASEKITFDPNDLTTRYSIQGGPAPQELPVRILSVQ